MSASRKGLKKHGLRGYVITGPRGKVYIERERRGRFLLRTGGTAHPFYNGEYRLLRDARRDAESWIGL